MTITLDYKGEERVAIVLGEHETYSHCFQVTPKVGFRSFEHSEMFNVRGVPLTTEQLDFIPMKIKVDQGLL